MGWHGACDDLPAAAHAAHPTTESAMNNELKLLGAMFALNALMLAVLLTVMLGLAPTPQSVFAGASSARQPASAALSTPA